MCSTCYNSRLDIPKDYAFLGRPSASKGGAQLPALCLPEVPRATGNSSSYGNDVSIHPGHLSSFPFPLRSSCITLQTLPPCTESLLPSPAVSNSSQVSGNFYNCRQQGAYLYSLCEDGRQSRNNGEHVTVLSSHFTCRIWIC